MGSEKEIVDDGVAVVLHRKGFGHERKAADFLQALAKGGNDHVVILLDKVRCRK